MELDLYSKFKLFISNLKSLQLKDVTVSENLELGNPTVNIAISLVGEESISKDIKLDVNEEELIEAIISIHQLIDSAFELGSVHEMTCVRLDCLATSIFSTDDELINDIALFKDKY